MNGKSESTRRTISAFLTTLMLIQGLPLQALAIASGKSDSQRYPGAPLPVDLRTGEIVLAAEDLKVGIDALPLTVSRVYRSDMAQTQPGVFGCKWYSVVDMEIILKGDDLTLLDESGRLREYGKQADGSWVSEKYDYETIRKDAGGTFVRQLKSGVSYLFGANNTVAEIRDLNGRFLRFTDQGTGTNRTILIEDRCGRQINMACNVDGHVIRVTDSANRTCRYGYDDQGNLATFQNRAGGQVAMNYDRDHRLTGLDGGATKYSVQYKSDRIAMQKTEFGLIASYDYTEVDGNLALQMKNAAGAVSRLEFNKDGKVTATDPTGVRETMWLNERELPVKAVGADGRTAMTTYDAHANVVSVDANGAVSRFTYGPDDSLQTVQAATGESVALTYDGRRNVTSTVNQRGAVTKMEWNDQGQLVAAKGPTGQSISLSYDSNGQVREMATGDGQKTTLDFTLLGLLRGVTTPTGVQISYRYDLLDRVIGVENSEGQKATLVRDEMGRVVKAVDPAGNETTMEYDPSGLLKTAHDPIGAVTRLAYDNLGNVKSFTDAKENVTQWTHDPAGRVLSEIDALGRPKVAKYNDKGQLLEQVNRRGQKTTLSYDDHGQAVATDPNGDPASFAYDSLGRLVRMKDADSDYRFDFTGDGMLQTVTDGVTGVPVSYEYDSAGRRVKMKAGDDEVHYAYDEQGRLNSIESAVGKVTFEYDQYGRRSAMLYPNGVRTTYAYDKLNRLTELRAVGQNGTEVVRYRYTYDILGNRTSMTDGADAVTQYSYDTLSRLTKVTGGTNITEYAYDSVGNRVAVTANGNKEEYATGKDNQLVAAGQAAFQYDADGNMVSRTTTDGKHYAYRYDSANRLAEAIGPDGTAAYGYAPNGRRVSRTQTGQKETRFLFDQEDMIAELTSNTQAAAYLHGPGIDQPLAQRRGDATVFYQADGLGSITGLTDAKGTSTGRYTYDAFGQSKQTESGMANPYRYTGREWDRTAGSYFYRARFYLPDAGRFSSHDPLGLTQGPNQYAYCANDPVNHMDPSGLLTVHIWRGEVGSPNLGHASITLDNGTYISWWPQEFSNPLDLPGRFMNAGALWTVGVNAYQSRSYEGDIHGESGNPDADIAITGLDETAIELWWNDFTSNHRWSTLGQNCSTTVAQALQAGGGDYAAWGDPRNWWMFGVWTPSSVEEYAYSIVTANNLVQEYINDPSGGTVGGGAWNSPTTVSASTLQAGTSSGIQGTNAPVLLPPNTPPFSTGSPIQWCPANSSGNSGAGAVGGAGVR